MKESEIYQIALNEYPDIRSEYAVDMVANNSKRIGFIKGYQTALANNAKELRPLRELAEDKEMCEEIARLCNPKNKEVFAVSINGNSVKIVMEDYDLIVYENGQLEYADDFGNQTPDNTFAICALISSKYKIGE
jgi:hypothetical protein